MSSVRPSSPDLTWGMLSRIMLGFRRGRKVRHGIVIIPHCCLPTFALEGFIFLHSKGKGVMVLLHGQNTMDSAV